MITLLQLARSRDIELIHNSGRFYGACPFCENPTPKCFVVKEDTFKCKDCKKTGDTADFLASHDGVSRSHALAILKDGETALQKPVGSLKHATIRKLSCPLDAEATDDDFVNQVFEFYNEQLLNDEKNLKWLADKGITDLDMLKGFKIGFADRTLGLRIPQKGRSEGLKMRNRLEDLNLFKESGHGTFNGCFVTPIMNSGKITQVYGHKKYVQQRDKVKELWWHENKGVFNHEAFAHREAILTDCVLAALVLIQNGYTNTSVSFSDDDLLELVKTCKTESITVAFASTKEGVNEAGRMVNLLKNEGVSVSQVRFPWKSQIVSYTQRHGAEKLAEVMGDAMWLGGGIKKEQVDKTPVLTQNGDYYNTTLGNIEYRVGGLSKNNSLEVMKITLRVSHDGLMHVDSIDLYKDSDRRRFIQRAKEEVLLSEELVKKDMGRLLLALEPIQEKRLAEPLEEKEETSSLTDAEQKEAMAFLKSPDLLEKIVAAYDKIGLIGERTNKLTAYLACVSRLFRKPLAVCILSQSAAGKSALMDSVLEFFDDKHNYSAVTGQSLFYQDNLKHKILAISEDIGFEKASGSLKLLQSQGNLSISSTSKCPKSGRMLSMDYYVEGPICLLFSTTSVSLDEELMNRCVVLTINESEEQTLKIHDLQRFNRTIEGIIAKQERDKVIQLMCNVEKLIKPMVVVNPYANELSFKATSTRTRRDHEKYLTLIDSICLLKQHQKEVKEYQGLKYIEVSQADIKVADELADTVFTNTLHELPPQTKNMLDSIKSMLKNTERYFTRKELRHHLQWSDYQVRTHLTRLESMEYIFRERGKQGRQCQYSLLTES